MELWELNDTSNPFEGVHHHPRLSLYGKQNPVRLKLKVFIEYNVKKYTGLDIVGFLELPRYIQNEVLELCLEQSKKEAKKSMSILEELEELDE